MTVDAWDRGWAEPPTGLDLCITDACDLRCRYCPLWGEDGLKPTPRMMPTDGMLGLVEELAPFKPSIRLFGGEALLHPDWPALVDAARARGLWVSAVSNGMRLADHAEKMVRTGLLAVGVSLDGIGEINDCHRGPRSFETIRHGLEVLEEVKAKTGSAIPWVEIYTTIQKSNFDHLVDFAEEIATWGVKKYRLQHLIWCSPSQYRHSLELLRTVDPGWDFYGDEPSHIRDRASGVDPGRLTRELRELASRTWPFEIEIHPNIPEAEITSYHTSREYRRRFETGCHLMEYYAFVDPSGTLRPCLHVDMGNVLEQGFLEVWNGDPFRAFRRFIRRNGRLPICQRCPD